jgi:hypothetical protein
MAPSQHKNFAHLHKHYEQTALFKTEHLSNHRRHGDRHRPFRNRHFAQSKDANMFNLIQTRVWYGRRFNERGKAS